MREIDQESVSRVSPNQLRRYLIATGWSSVRQVESTFVEAFSHTAGFYVFVPKSQALEGAFKRIRDTIRTVADAENRSAWDIIRSLQTWGYDVIRSSIPSALIRDDSIPLSTALAFTRNAKSLLAYTASSEVNALPFFGRVRKAGIEYSDACRFGHTFHGSFGFTVESPLPPPTQRLFAEIEVAPFERKVLERLTRGIKLVAEAAEMQSVLPIVNGIRHGLNANGCDVLADLISEVSPGGLNLEVSFSTEAEYATDTPSFAFFLTAQHSDIARQAARELRRNDVDFRATVRGLTVRLQNQTDPSDIASSTGEHEISVLWSSEDLGDIQVSVNLLPQEYLRAVSAHASGRSVTVMGLLKKTGRKWVLSEPEGFSIVDQGEL